MPYPHPPLQKKGLGWTQNLICLLFATDWYSLLFLTVEQVAMHTIIICSISSPF